MLGLGLLVAFSSLGLACGGPPREAQEAALPPNPGSPLELTLPRLRGGTFAFSSLRGRPVLVALFTTWSLRCQLELPRLERLHERYRGRGLALVGIAIDQAREQALITTYVEVLRLRLEVLLSAPDDLELVSAFGLTRQVPRTLLLDGAGRVILDQSGQTLFPPLERKIQALLGKR
jgi:thiol-disulfide isomerase/thioredoxin